MIYKQSNSRVNSKIYNMIPFDKRDGFIWYNNEIIAWQDATIHVLTHGLHYASSVFEGIRVYNGKIFKLEEHMERLHQSANILDFIIPYSIKELCEATNQLIKMQQLNNGYIRPIAWKGSERLSCSAPDNKIHTAIACWEIPEYMNSSGIKLNISKWVKPPPSSIPFTSKAAGIYMISTLSKQDAEKAGFDDSLMLDYRGYVAEATVANFFMVKDNILHTPLPDCFLNGITRRIVISIAKQENVKVIERHILPTELKEADELFITGTTVEIKPIIQIEQQHYVVGDITKLIMQKYRQLVLQN